MSEPKTTLGLNQYQCSACGGVFDKGWSDSEAIAELQETFPGKAVDECALVCDDCFKAMGFRP
jgi:hypothetical protein